MTANSQLAVTDLDGKRRRGGKRGPVAFKQRDVARLMRGAQAAGLTVIAVEVHNGTLRVLTGAGVETVASQEVVDLDRELEEFEAKHGEG